MANLAWPTWAPIGPHCNMGFQGKEKMSGKEKKGKEEGREGLRDGGIEGGREERREGG